MSPGLSARSRRAAAATTSSSSPSSSSSGSSSSSAVSRFLLLTTALLSAACVHLLLHWRPVDTDNIGRVLADEFMAYGPIDVVYTWVNGSDPRWRREKDYWHRHWVATLTGQPPPRHPDDDAHEVRGQDVSNADNRFRDNEELRYSLRSLEKYAPWIRRVFIVTDGQIPTWLNMEAPNLEIVPHRAIFEHPAHLPVFSSPAIEWNLDNIPGLSEHFLYFNDDVFLGSPTRPEDFISQRGVQKVYFAWEVPQCATGCWDSWLGNGRCDPQCNVTMCDFDMGDCGCAVDKDDGHVTCDPLKIAAIREAAPPRAPKIADHLCHGACHYRWLGDGTCDPACNTTTCGFDAGDCGLGALGTELPRATIDANHTLLEVPLTVNATYVHLTMVFGANGSVHGASHDNEPLLRHATVFEGDLGLLVVFGRDDEGDPMTHAAMITVHGADGHGAPVQLDLEVVRGATTVHGGGEVAGFATFQNTSIRPRLIRLPFGFRQATWTASLEPVEAVNEEENDEDATEDQATPTMEPYMELFLPFNLTGKQVGPGERLTLVMDTVLRLHNDTDLEYADVKTCELTIPEPTPTPTGTRVNDVDGKNAEDPQETSTVTVEVDAASDAAVVDVVGPSPTEPDDTESTPDIDREETSSPSSEEETFCRMVDGGLQLRFRLPTFDNVEDAQDASAPTGDSTETADAVAKGPRLPQVSDGHICFFNQDNDEKKYCFALALGYHQADRVRVAKRPVPSVDSPVTKREKAIEVPYEPYSGDNVAWLEFVNHCMDTTRRLIGIRPRKCYWNEVPALFPEDVDPTIKNTEEGRRLACESKKRRLAEMEESKKREREERRNGGVGYIFRSWVNMGVAKVKSLLNVDTVIVLDDDIDDNEYEDVCRPFIEEDAAAAVNEVSAENAEALLSKDTFGDSLRYVNRLYNRVFGKPASRRRVPSHMPFLLSRSIIREIKDRWPKEFEATSSHRFRHPQDMQFSFSYFHYLLNRHKIHPPTLEFIWKEYLDVNRNGILDENEILTVASLAHGDYPPDSFVEEVKTCLRPPKVEKVSEKATAKGTVLVAETLSPHIKFEHLQVCTNISQSLIKNVRKEKMFELMPEDEVTFHMLSDQYRYAWNQMLGTRARRTKFVCINDDMKFPSRAVSQILHELFLSIWPKQSQFELPYHLKNRYDHIDEYNTAKERRELFTYIAGGVALLLVLIFWSDLRKIFGFQDIARARAESASQLSQELEQLDDAPDGSRESE